MSITYRLRSAAERYGLAAPQTATLMMEAADTIDAMCAMRDTWQENDAKLRELVRHLYACWEHPSCSTCEYNGDACDFYHDMRELGMEVE